MAELMRTIDFFVFPSRYDPFGLVLLEAAASGAPVITAQTAGGAQLVDGAGGIVLEDPDDVDALAEAMNRLVADKSLRREMGKQARSMAEQHSWSNMASRYLELYNLVRPDMLIKPSRQAASAP